MQYIISGGQRQGKTNFCVLKMKSYLLGTDRHIYTNLPIYPDIIAKQIVQSESRNPINFHEEIKPILERIHIIRKFPAWDELRDFRKKNPVYCMMHRSRNRKLDFEYEKIIVNGVEVLTRIEEVAVNHDRLFFPISCIYEFWRYKRFNSIIMIDEIYNYFNSLDYKRKGEERVERRLALLNYVLQHGHDKDDLYFITHDVSLIDQNVQKGVQYTYICYNSLNRNMIPNDVIKRYENVLHPFRGLKNLIMYFIIEGFDRDNKTKDPNDFWKIRADKENFKCYNSFSKREGANHKILLNKVVDSSKLASSDINKSKWLVIKEFLVQAWPSFLVMGLFLLLIFFTIKAVYKILYAHRGEKKPAVEKVEENKKIEQGGLDKDKVKMTPVMIKGVTSNSIYYSDNFKIKVGDIYEGFEVVSITRTVTVLKRDGKEYRVSTNGIRTEKQSSEK